MNSLIPRDEFMRLLYEQAAREQRDLAVRVRAARGNEHHAADFERRATLLVVTIKGSKTQLATWSPWPDGPTLLQKVTKKANGDARMKSLCDEL